MSPKGTDDEVDPKDELRYRGTRERDIDFLTKSKNRSGMIVTASGLQYRVRSSGPKDGQRPGPSSPCRVHYRGILTDGTVFDSSFDRGTPVVFRPDQVVAGWTEALQLMRPGDKWEIVIPAHLGYGQAGAGPIPGGAVLIFEMDLLEIDVKEGQGLLYFGGIGVLILLGLIMAAYLHFSRAAPDLRGPSLLPEDGYDKNNPYVFFDVEIGEKPAGRIEFELFSKITPKTAENFRALATGEKGIGESGKPLHYKDTIFHRVIPGFMCQGGDTTSGNGRGGESIYGRSFNDEWVHGQIHHSIPGLLSMANRGPNTQSSQFFITTAVTNWLDGKHVVFGRVSRGMDVVKTMEGVGSKSGTPTQKIVIANSGQLSGPYGSPIEPQN